MSLESNDRELDECEWPAEWTQLAERLTREAAELSQQYPPKGESAAAAAAKEPIASDCPQRGAWWIGGGAVAILLAVIMLAAANGLAPGGNAPHAAGDIADSQAKPPAAGRPAEREPVQETIRVRPVSYEAPLEEPRSQVSAPEWEAVLDLTPAENWEGMELSL